MIDKTRYSNLELLTNIGRKSFFTRKYKYNIGKLIDAINKYDLYFDNELIQWMINNPSEINGCGAKNGMKIYQYMWFLFIGWACFLHDGMWGKAKTKKEVYFANEIFDNNLKKIVDYYHCMAKTGISRYVCTTLQVSRRLRIGKYVTMVEVIGTPIFLNSKEL